MGDSPKNVLASLPPTCTGSFGSDLLVYGAVIGVFYAIDYYRKYREREVLASQLERQLAHAQLDSLPHAVAPTLFSSTR
jgi:hypothetical protein